MHAFNSCNCVLQTVSNLLYLFGLKTPFLVSSPPHLEHTFTLLQDASVLGDQATTAIAQTVIFCMLIAQLMCLS